MAQKLRGSRSLLLGRSIGLSLIFVGLMLTVSSMLFLPRGPQCLGTIDQCASVLGRGVAPAILESNPMNWGLISMGVILGTIALGCFSMRGHSATAIDGAGDPR